MSGPLNGEEGVFVKGDYRAAIMNYMPKSCKCFIKAGWGFSPPPAFFLFRVNAQSPQNREIQIALQLSHEHTFNLVDLSLCYEA